jgi:phosphoribosylglycinamide formyltransferase-1
MISGEGRLALEAIHRSGELGFLPHSVILDTTASSKTESSLRSMGLQIFRLSIGSKESVQSQIWDIYKNQTIDKVFLTFDRILDKQVLSLFPSKFINLHLSLLPAFPGMRALERALEMGVPFVGATMHLATPKVDDGPTLAQCIHPVAEGETRESIGQKLFPLIRVLYLNVVRWSAQGRILTDLSGRARILDTRPGTGRINPEPEWCPET